MFVRRIENKEAFMNLQPEWNKLLRKSYSDSFFLTWEWVFSWWNIYGKDKKLFILTLYEKELLIGIAPLVLSSKKYYKFLKMNVLEFLGSENVSGEFLDFILITEEKERGIEAFLNYLIKHSEKWDILNLSNIPEISPLSKRLKSLNKSERFYYNEKIRICPYTKLPNSWTDFYNLPSVKIKRFERKYKKFIKLFEIEFCLTNKKTLKGDLNRFFKLHQRRWQAENNEGAFLLRDKKNFYKLISKITIAKDLLRLYSLKKQNEIIACLYGFEYENNFYYLQSGYDIDWKKYSVGTILMRFIFQEAISKGLRNFEFLRGAESYKFIWGAKEKRNICYILKNKKIKTLIYNKILGIEKKLILVCPENVKKSLKKLI